MIINNINKVYKEKLDNMNSLLDNKFKYLIKFNKIGKHNYMLIQKNNKTVLGCLYNFYGIYQQHTNLWIWASTIPNVDINTIKKVNSIKNFSHLFESQDGHGCGTL